MTLVRLLLALIGVALNSQSESPRAMVSKEGAMIRRARLVSCVFGGVLLAASPSKYNSTNLGNRTVNRTGDNVKYTTAVLLALLLAACGGESTSMTASDESSGTEEFSVSDSGVKTKNVEGFGGVIAESYGDSQEWWAEEERPNEDAPNVIIFLLDDVGFAQVESFGGLIRTPNIDALAENGLRYNNFHTTALCLPSRATLMAGRNPHSIGMGSHALTAMGFPGYNAIMPESAKSVANYLQEEGYVNYALGKWDHTPLYEVSQVGPFDRWPSGEGFQHAYTFMAADVHQFVPLCGTITRRSRITSQCISTRILPIVRSNGSPVTSPLNPTCRS